MTATAEPIRSKSRSYEIGERGLYVFYLVQGEMHNSHRTALVNKYINEFSLNEIEIADLNNRLKALDGSRAGWHLVLTGDEVLRLLRIVDEPKIESNNNKHSYIDYKFGTVTVEMIDVVSNLEHTKDKQYFKLVLQKGKESDSREFVCDTSSYRHARNYVNKWFSQPEYRFKRLLDFGPAPQPKEKEKPMSSILAFPGTATKSVTKAEKEMEVISGTVQLSFSVTVEISKNSSPAEKQSAILNSLWKSLENGTIPNLTESVCNLD